MIFMKRLTLVVLVVLVLTSACENRKDNSAETPKVMDQVPVQETEPPSDDQQDADLKSHPVNTIAEPSRADRIEMPKPGVISEYDKTIRRHARRYGFDWRLISAQIYTESRFRHEARSYRGALGLMQIMPGTARWLEGKAESEVPELEGVSNLLVNPEMNIHLGCYYDAMLFSRIKNTKSGPDRQKMMFAAYNAGPRNLNRSRRKSDAPQIWEEIEPHLPEETRKYIPTIFGKYEVYKKWTVLTPY